MDTVYLNGQFIPLDKAMVPVMDRGFLFGDGVYEVIPVYGGRLFRIEAHLQRLQNSLDSILLVNPNTASQWETLLNNLLDENDCHNRNIDYSIYLQVTRGAAEKRDHRFPTSILPTIFANCNAIQTPDSSIASIGIKAITVEDTRWTRCDIKAITLLPNVLLRQQAEIAGADEAILIRDGNVLEGSASNLFIVTDGTLKTQPKSNQLLPGITRDLVIELAHQHKIPCEETNITVDCLFGADEVWVTSSTREIMAVTRINKKKIGTGKPGAICQQMKKHYQNYKESVRAGKAS